RIAGTFVQVAAAKTAGVIDYAENCQTVRSRFPGQCSASAALSTVQASPWHSRYRAMKRRRSDVRFRGYSGHDVLVLAFPLLMRWTAPTLRHLSAIGLLRRNAPL